METFVTIIHIIVAISLIVLVLIQDSKGGGALGIGGGGGGGANSLFGATGAQSLASKLTRIVAVAFAITCLTLTAYYSKKQTKSVIDGTVLPSAPAQQAPAPETASPTEAETAPKDTAPAAPANK